ncbi:MAG: PorT family protein [Chitinophagaceae bacterium]|nr:PorT family protein [Chitinophagaceae bacterium]
MNPRMKFVIISFLLLTTATANSYAQKLHYGVTVGTNLYKVTGRSFDEKTRAGFSAGAYGEYFFNRMLGVQSELMWSQVRTVTSADFNQIYGTYGGVSNANVYLNYISLPVMFAFKPTPELSILLGPQYSYLVNQTSGLLAQPQWQNKDAFKKSEFSLVFGGQLNLGKVKIGARYSIGLSNMNGINSSDEWRYHGFHFSLGYQLK